MTGVSVYFETVPIDCCSFISDLQNTLEIVYTWVCEDVHTSSDRIEKQVNCKMHLLNLTVGNYLYLQKEPTGTGQKVQVFRCLCCQGNCTSIHHLTDASYDLQAMSYLIQFI